ncbi:NAD(P)-binding protein [Pyrenochaeta sp. DS3sAY3a]|nr:NAD(P)-binding protein [Pyrenochaeta sp. DS3sAY3a]
MPPSPPNCKPPQSILIIGGGRGIGLEIVKYLMQSKRQVVVITAFDKSFEWSEDDIIPYVGNVVTIVQGDVTLAEDRARVLQKSSNFKGIDTLIYCAGIITPIKRIEKLDINDVKMTFDVNVFGAMEMSRLCLPFLRKSRIAHPLNTGHGKIIILSSACDSDVTYHGWSPYCTTKAALTRFISCLAHEEPLVSVQGVYPKLTRTKMPEDVIAGKYDGVMADHEVERFRIWDEMGDEMVEPPEWCGEAVAKLALGLFEGGKSGETLYYDEHVPKKITGT